MATPHKHAALIKAWADGAAVQFRNRASGSDGQWHDCNGPMWWLEHYEFCLKPLPPPDVVSHMKATYTTMTLAVPQEANLKLTFDGDTGELKTAEVLK